MFKSKCQLCNGFHLFLVWQIGLLWYDMLTTTQTQVHLWQQKRRRQIQVPAYRSRFWFWSSSSPPGCLKNDSPSDVDSTAASDPGTSRGWDMIHLNADKWRSVGGHDIIYYWKSWIWIKQGIRYLFCHCKFESTLFKWDHIAALTICGVGMWGGKEKRG